MTEPRVTVTNVDNTLGLSTPPVDNRLNILCPVISPAGPLELTRVTGPSEFRRLFFGGSGVTANDDVTAYYARALVSSAPIWVKRGCRNTMRGGFSANTASDIYVDENLQPIQGMKVALSAGEIVPVYDTTTQTGALTTYLKQNPSGVVKSGNYLYTESEVQGTFVKASVQKSIRIVLQINRAVTGSTNVTIGDTVYEMFPDDADLTRLVTAMAEDGMYPQFFKGDEITGNISDLSATTAIPEGITAIGFVAPVSIMVEYNEESDDGALSVITSDDISTIVGNGGKIYATTIKTEAENINTWELDNPSITITINGDTDYAFYSGTFSGEADVKTELRYSGGLVGNVSNANPTFYEFMEVLTHEIANMFHGGTYASDGLIIPNATAVSATGLEYTTESINTVTESERFAIIARFPCDTDLFEATVSVADKENGIYTVLVEYQDEKEEWNFGFNASLVDGYGNSLYYENVNMNSDLIYIVELDGDAVPEFRYTTSFGGEVTSHYSNINDIQAAYESIIENDETTVRFDYITDCGKVNPTLSAYILSTMCEKYHSFYPVSTPERFTKDDLISQRTNLGSNWQGNFIPASQRSSMVDSGSVVLPGSFWYLTRRIDLGNTAQEFLPLFGPTNGGINVTNPIQTFKLSEREELLDYQIPTLKRDPSSGYYLNDNPTLYQTDSYLQEDGIVLMVNKVAQVADAYGQTLIGQYNTAELRATVRSALGTQLKDRLRVGTQNGPLSIRVQCDRSNNTDNVINNRQIRIDIYSRFTRSIREVRIYSQIMPLE